MSRDRTSLLDILHAARQILAFTRDMDRGAFDSDPKTQSAVLHQLLIVGEAGKRISPGYRELHPQLPWKQMTGMRDNLIHGYDGIDLDEVWVTVQRDIPALIAAIEPLLSGEP